MTYVKICGVQSVEEALAARDAGAHFVGIVFAESKRRVSIETAKGVSEALGGLAVSDFTDGERRRERLERLLRLKRPLLVGVFDGQNADEIESIAEQSQVDLVQLHRCELPGSCRRWPLIAATEGYDLARANPGGSMVLVDGSRGRGRRGDWESLEQVSASLSFILAGGLTPENVAGAVRRLRPWGVDVSSGVETSGHKDPVKMKAFVAAVKGAFDEFSSR
jgi:phosphoribosylanthranilate isomerase